jgi:hypothetical protein
MEGQVGRSSTRLKALVATVLSIILVIGAFSGKPSFAQDEAIEWPGDPCFSNDDCGWLTEYCQKPAGFCNGEGICVERPHACVDIWLPVCGCDGNTYGNDCYAAANGVSVAYLGECREPCECDLNFDGKCNILDWPFFIEDWGRTDCGTPPGSGNPPNDCECDLNFDGTCNILDWPFFIEDWGRTDCSMS